MIQDAKHGLELSMPDRSTRGFGRPKASRTRHGAVVKAFTTSFSKERGWWLALPAGDPARALIVCFGAPEYVDDTEAIRQLTVEVGGTVVGCSTAGEIHGSEGSDGTLSVAGVEFEATMIKSRAMAMGGARAC